MFTLSPKRLQKHGRPLFNNTMLVSKNKINQVFFQKMLVYNGVAVPKAAFIITNYIYKLLVKQCVGYISLHCFLLKSTYIKVVMSVLLKFHWLWLAKIYIDR